MAPVTQGGIPDIPIVADVTDFGADGDDASDDGAAFAAAIASVSPPGAVLVPAGTYHFDAPIGVPSGVVLRGVGRSRTLIDCAIANPNYSCISLWGTGGDVTRSVVGGATHGSGSLDLDDSSGIAVGDVLELSQENDEAVLYTRDRWREAGEGWAHDAVGQMMVVTDVAGNRIEFEPELGLTFSARLAPRVRLVRAVREAGVEALHVTRNNGEHTIGVGWCQGCWIRDIESSYSASAHVYVSRSLNTEIRDSYFHHSHDYGDGGRGYGVSLTARSTLTLVENNVFATLRHSFITSLGVYGNVYAYNYSREPRTADPGYALTDTALHGFYSYGNLIEGNVVEQIVSADYWGPSGPNNTILRNRVRTKGISIRDSSHDQVVLGNELMASDIDVASGIRGTVMHGNNVAGAVSWDTSYLPEGELPDSLYRASKPPFFGALPWPPMGYGTPLGSGTIPAVERWNDELAP